MSYLTEEDIDEVNKEFPEHDRHSCDGVETYTMYNVGFHSGHGGVYCKRCQAFFEKEASRKAEKLLRLEQTVTSLEESLAKSGKKPTLKEFCVKAGCLLLKGDFKKEGHKGNFAWCLSSKSNIKYVGYTTEEKAYSSFLSDTTTPEIAKQIKKLLRKT